MKERNGNIVIVFAEDDEDDYLLVKEALGEVGLAAGLYWVHDGEELMDYLLHRNLFQDVQRAPWPSLILLDLNMPKKDGRQALREIKQDPKLCKIPVVALTTSKSETDILRTYELGVNSLISKPLYYEGYVEIAKTLKKYWIDVVHLPIVGTEDD